MPKQVFVNVGDKLEMQISYSEAACYMGVAGTRMLVELLDHHMAQLYNLDGRVFSFPITSGEAGFYQDGDRFYCYPDGI